MGVSEQALQPGLGCQQLAQPTVYLECVQSAPKTETQD